MQGIRAGEVVMGKTLALLILTQICSNSWWMWGILFDASIRTPFFAIPFVSTIVLFFWLLGFVVMEWD